MGISGLKANKAKSEKCLASQKSKKSGRAFTRTRTHSGNRLTNGLRMVLLPSRIMQRAETTTPNPRKVTL